tara:strand:+ start:1950 stop:3548 length:1599 start_codon:yes stop_codon:yes gene_type:complete
MAPKPGFRERMKNIAKGGYRQASGKGVNLPTPTGLALAPIQGVSNLIGLGGVFQSLQQQTSTWFENTRRFNSDASKFRSLLTRDAQSINKTTRAADDLLRGSLVERAEGQRGTLQKFKDFDSDIYNSGKGKNSLADRLGLSTGDITRLSMGVAQSGLEGTGRDFKGLAVLSGAVERGMNISAESQAQFFSGFGRNAGAHIKAGFTPAQQAASDLKSVLGQATATKGAGLMNADVPAYLQEISTMMRADARQGIKLSTESVLGLGQTMRNESSMRKLFQGFAGLGAGQSVIQASRGVMGGQGSQLDQAMLFRQANKGGGRSLFDTMLTLEEGGKGGREFSSMFEGYLNDLRDTVGTDKEREGLAVMLKQQGGLFGDMGLKQILSLLQGGEKETVDPLTDKQIQERAEKIVDPTQKSLAALDRAEVQAMQTRMKTRVKIMKMESETGRAMAKQLEELETASVKYVGAAIKNVQRFSNVSDILSKKTSGVAETLEKFGKAISTVIDIISDSAAGESTVTPAEKALKPKKRKAKKP